jgi:hypothetical protein
MKTSRRRPDNVLDMPPADGKMTPPAPPARASEAQIAERAYQLYCARGCQDGSDVDDWLQAENDLRRDERISAA